MALVAATCNPPGWETGTARESVRPNSPFEFVDGTVEAQVRVSMPAGALVGAEDATAHFAVSTSTPDPFSQVEVQLGGPLDGRAVLDRAGNYGFDFDWPLPDDCEAGCEVLVPVTLRHAGDGEEPSFGWSMQFVIAYDSLVPPEVEDMTATIEDPTADH